MPKSVEEVKLRMERDLLGGIDFSASGDWSPCSEGGVGGSVELGVRCQLRCGIGRRMGMPSSREAGMIDLGQQRLVRCLSSIKSYLVSNVRVSDGGNSLLE